MTNDRSLSLAIRSLELADANLLAALCVMQPGVWQTATEVNDQFVAGQPATTAKRLGKLTRLGLAESRRPPWTAAAVFTVTAAGRQVNALIDEPLSVTDSWTRSHLSALCRRSGTAALGAAVASTMWEAGLDSGALAWWWRRARSELGGRSPREALHEDQPAVLALARQDAEAQRAENRRIAHEQQERVTA